MKKARFLFAEAVRGGRGIRTSAREIASSFRQRSKYDKRASRARCGQWSVRIANRLLCTMLVLGCVAFFAQNASAQTCTSLASGDWNDTTKWSCGVVPTSGAGVITVAAGHTMTVTAAVTVDQVTVNAGGQITVNNGVILTLANGTGVDLTINGSLSVKGSISMNTFASISVAGIATVENAAGGGPGAIFANDQENVITVAVGGQLIVRSPGNGSSAQGVRLIDGNGGDQLLVNGTLTVEDGEVFTQHGNSFVVNGSASFSGTSNLTTSFGAAGVGANINNNGTLSFSGSSTWTLTTAPIANVNSGGTLEIGPSAVVNGGGSLNVAAGANLKIGSTAGIASAGATGNVQTGGRSFSSGANYTYNGVAAQVTGVFTTTPTAATVNDLTIDNSAGVTLSGNRTCAGLLSLTTGDLLTTASFTLSQSGTGNGGLGSSATGPGDVIGTVSRIDFGTTTRSFGNVNVQVNGGTGGGISTMMVNLVKQAPPSFPSAVTRVYTLTPGTGTIGTGATLRLRYKDSELNGNTDETMLQLWRLEAGTPATWQPKGGTVDDTNNHVTATVTGFSSWVIAGPDAPTDVAMVKMKATRVDNRILLEWQTGNEVRNLGFNIYREQKGNYTRINPEPVAGSALLFGPRVALRAGFAYAWWDRGIADCGLECEGTRYWIEDMDLSGHTSFHGPFGVDRSTSDEAAAAVGKEAAPLLGAIGSDAAKLGASAPVERRAKILKPTAAGLTAQATIATQQAVKLSVKHEGWYRVEQADLLAAGFPANSDSLKLQLFVDGQEVPIRVTTAGTTPGKGSKPISAPWDGIEFYGIGIDSAFTDSHVYWLVAGTQNGLRVNTVPSPGGSPAPATFPFAVERRDKVVYFPSLQNGGAEKFFGPVIYNAQAVDQSLTLQHVATTGSATLDVTLQGYTDAPHSVSVLLNGSELGTVQFSGLTKGTAQYSVPQTSLLEGSNQIQFISPAGFSDITMVELVRMTYQHTNTADGNSLRFPATGSQQATIAGFTSAAVRVLDVTNPGSPQEIETTVEQDGAEYTATVTVPGAGSRTLLAFAADQKKTPAALVANQPSSWRTAKNGADYIAVTRKDLINSIQPLANQRKSQGLKTAVVDIEDVYDEFSFGHKTPQALKDFFVYTKTSWKIGPRFALLGGDATYDPKNYTGVGDFDVIPTRLFESAFSETATDDWFVDVDGDFVPDIAIGRLPVRTPQETATLAAKIVRYDRSAAVPRVLLVADHNDGYDFEAAATQLQSMIPASLTVIDIRRGQVGDAAARTQLLEALNVGAKFVNYYGHGSTLVWTNASILTAADAASLGNTDRLALFDSMTCFTGFFHDVSIASLGEALLKAPGGAIAVWASSGMTDAGGQVQMNEEAMRLLFGGGGLTIGEVTARAKAATGNPDVRRTWILLGDPATKLR